MQPRTEVLLFHDVESLTVRQSKKYMESGVLAGYRGFNEIDRHCGMSMRKIPVIIVPRNELYKLT